MATSCWLLLACCCAGPTDDLQREHSWNQVQRIFYTREFSSGEVYEHESALHPPWSSWARFYNDEEFHNRVIAVLDGFLKQVDADVESQPPLRRALMWRDLWPVFDAQTKTYSNSAGGTPGGRQQQIRERVARAMRRLELSDEEIKQLPDNFLLACEQGFFPATFDPASPETAFLPRDLFDKDGAWVAFAPRADVIGANQHVRHSEYRTIFVPFIRVSSDRKTSLDFLQSYSSARGPPGNIVPKGTMLALVRQTVLASSSGELLAAPLMENLQVIVVDPAGDYRFKFMLDRDGLLHGSHGLRVMKSDEPVDAWGFESGGLHAIQPKFDEYGERLPFGRWVGAAGRGEPTMEHCVACHGNSVRNRLFANTAPQPPNRAEPSTFDEQIRLIRSEKQTRSEWKTYRALSQ